MTRPIAALVEQLRGVGLDDRDAESRGALVATARDALTGAAGSAPAWTWIAPGRIEIFGKHTDYAGGHSLVAAAPRGFAIAAHPRSDGLVHAIDARWHESLTVNPASTTSYTGWRNYIAVVARRLHANFPGAEFGIDIAFASDLPRAAGLSSSSALVVGIATALLRRAGLETREDWRAVVTDSLDLAGYLGAVENGLTFKSLAGTSGVGTHGGSEDHTAILTCRGGRVSAYSYVPVTRAGDAAMPRDWRFVVTSSGVQADKAGSARDRYNRASLATRALVEVGRRSSGGSWPSLRALLAGDPTALTALRGRLDRGDEAGGFSSAALSARLAHFLGEDARVPVALEAFRNADVAAIGELSAASQRDADGLLENQIPETIELAAQARAQGAFAASSFGAGFGGSVWALAPAAEAEAFAARWLAAYLSRVSPPGPVESFICTPAPGVLEISA